MGRYQDILVETIQVAAKSFFEFVETMDLLKKNPMDDLKYREVLKTKDLSVIKRLFKISFAFNKLGKQRIVDFSHHFRLHQEQQGRFFDPEDISFFCYSAPHLGCRSCFDDIEEVLGNEELYRQT